MLSALDKFGVVAIGRNEGERLKQCLESLPQSARVVYVDSGSSDGSTDWARRYGVEVVELDSGRPFTAARARNAGFSRLRDLVSPIEYVQFVDGDCELVAGWTDHAAGFLDGHPDVAAVSGQRRERYPDRSIYNRLCDWEWDGPIGEGVAFGGDVMIRTTAFVAAEGYREDLIAGEDPELCVRLRSMGWHVWRLSVVMTLHDAAITSFGQWWRRCTRGGFAYAVGAYLHGSEPGHYRVWESCRAWIWGAALPLLGIGSVLAFGTRGGLVLLVYPVQLARQIARNSGPFYDRALLATFQLLARFPEVIGQMWFLFSILLGRKPRLIEYK